VRLLLTIDGLPGVSVPIALPDDHEIVQRARQYAANRETGNAAEHMQASIEDDIGMAVRVEVAP
jgi:hypothetical protein